MDLAQHCPALTSVDMVKTSVNFDVDKEVKKLLSFRIAEAEARRAAEKKRKVEAEAKRSAEQKAKDQANRKKNETLPVYRYFNGSNSDHFYTTNVGEIGTSTPGHVGKHGYRFEHIAFQVYRHPGTDRWALHRFCNRKCDHLYTTSSEEIARLGPVHGYSFEGIVGYVPKAGALPVYRYCSPHSGDHFYTQCAAEIGTTKCGNVGKHGYLSEGIGFFSAT